MEDSLYYIAQINFTMENLTLNIRSSNVNDSKNDTKFFSRHPPPINFETSIYITIYVVIFILSLVGNILVILTLIQNKRMRTVTNVFLLNLSISDLLLAVFCMPFTLIPNIMKNFIFGAAMCVMIRYFQGVSVGASCFTLVAISLERYFAICRPLRSRIWQTLSHSYKIIGLCWTLSGVVMIPIAVETRHRQIGPNIHLCREIWEDKVLEKAYTVFLDIILLLIPLCLMSGAYASIMRTLCIGIRINEPPQDYSMHGSANGSYRSAVSELTNLRSPAVRSYSIQNGSYGMRDSSRKGDYLLRSREFIDPNNFDSPCSSEESTPRRKIDQKRIIRHNNYEKSRNSKVRVIRMLSVVVVEFFICWTPLYTVQTWNIFHPTSLQGTISPVTWNLFFMLSYLSTCCNPITYCFMNKRFRNSFLAALNCCRLRRSSTLTRYPSMGSKNSCKTSMHRMTMYERALDSSSSDKPYGV